MTPSRRSARTTATTDLRGSSWPSDEEVGGGTGHVLRRRRGRVRQRLRSSPSSKTSRPARRHGALLDRYRRKIQGSHFARRRARAAMENRASAAPTAAPAARGAAAAGTSSSRHAAAAPPRQATRSKYYGLKVATLDVRGDRRGRARGATTSSCDGAAAVRGHAKRMKQVNEAREPSGTPAARKPPRRQPPRW